MNVHIVVSVYKGVIDGIQAFLDKEKAEKAKRESMEELGIVEGKEEESENAVVLFPDEPVIE